MRLLAILLRQGWVLISPGGGGTVCRDGATCDRAGMSDRQ